MAIWISSRPQLRDTSNRSPVQPTDGIDAGTSSYTVKLVVVDPQRQLWYSWLQYIQNESNSLLDYYGHLDHGWTPIH